MKIDPYNHKESYLKWKNEVKNKIPDITLENSEIILKYLREMEIGVNVASGSVKGSRSYIRLNSLREKMIYFSKKFKELYEIDKITDITEQRLFQFFSDIENGNIRRINGNNYKDVCTFIKIFKAFWHWHQKVNRKEGIEVPDITLDLNTYQEKPKWVYLNEEQVKMLIERAKYEYKVLILFLYDTGIRSPTELINLKVSDLYNDCKELHIREEISKTFGRRIKLMISSELVKGYIQVKELKSTDYLFPINHASVNKYLKRLAVKVLGDKLSDAGKKYSEISMYDFRHCSCCYWLPRYKSESALKYRFGWKKSDKIHYYSELLGMKDTISEEDLLIDVTKTEIEKRLTQSEKENQVLNERLKILESQMKQSAIMVKQVYSEV